MYGDLDQPNILHTTYPTHRDQALPTAQRPTIIRIGNPIWLTQDNWLYGWRLDVVFRREVSWDAQGPNQRVCSPRIVVGPLEPS